MDISDDLRVSCVTAHAKYTEFLNKKKDELADQEKRTEVANISTEIGNVIRQKEELKKTISDLEKSASECYDKAEANNNITEVTKGNAFRKASGEKRKLIKDLDNLEKERKEKMSKRSN